MNKQQLRKKFAKYEELQAHRLRCERAIIEALPTKLDVLRVMAPKTVEGFAAGVVEVEAADYGAALTLADHFPNLKPLPLTQVTTWRTPGHKTVSFIPSCRVPVRWHNDPHNTSIGEVYPVLFQMTPSDDPLRPKVCLEWYAELAHELVVNVRAIVKHHPVTWRRQPGSPRPYNGYWWPDSPEADCERVLQMREGQPPYVTLWWHKGCDYFTFALLGDGKEVARG